jgi:beta-galactosidase
MKIKKIKSQGEYCYPATIAAAVKDANFTKSTDIGDVPMT